LSENNQQQIMNPICEQWWPEAEVSNAFKCIGKLHSIHFNFSSINHSTIVVFHRWLFGSKKVHQFFEMLTQNLPKIYSWFLNGAFRTPLIIL